MASEINAKQEAQLDAAEARGDVLMDTAMQAAKAGYDRATGRVTIDLTNGCAYVFPARLVQDLDGATDDQLACVKVDGFGFNLHWPDLDADLYVPALVSGIFGTRDWISAACRSSHLAGQGGGLPHKRREGWSPSQGGTWLTFPEWRQDVATMP